MPSKLLSAIILWVLSLSAVQAHEVWIAPTDWTPSVGEDIRADIKNGHDFVGVDLSWNADSAVRAELWSQDGTTQIDGRLGDRPAITVQSASDGLATIVYQSTYRNIVYATYEKFAGFVTGKGYASVLDHHAERRLPEAPIKEAYVRFAKSLIAVDGIDGTDEERGLELELVALANPYMPDVEELTVQLLYRSEPFADNQVTVFERDMDGTVTSQVMRSDVQGQVQFPLRTGVTYLVDSVVIREPTRELVAASRGAVWESLWTSLTFEVPPSE